MALERTYIMIKPNAVAERHVGDIIARIERTGLSIERMELAVLTEEQAEANYAEHVEKPFFRELVDFITSGPVVKMVVSGESAIKKMRTLMGATNPIDAAKSLIMVEISSPNTASKNSESIVTRKIYASLLR